MALWTSSDSNDVPLLSFVPEVIVNQLQAEGHSLTLPRLYPCHCLAMFIDISGYTALSEKLTARGDVGAEELGLWLNRYFEQILRIIAKFGGDVLKFAGDALLVLWPDVGDFVRDRRVRREPTLVGGNNALEVDTALRVVQCARAVQQELNNVEMAEGVRFQVKIGVGIGSAALVHIGGVFDRVEYLAVGDVLSQVSSVYITPCRPYVSPGLFLRRLTVSRSAHQAPS